MVPRGEYLKALRQVEILQRQLQDLENSNIELKTTVRTMMGIRRDAGLHKVSENLDLEPASSSTLDCASAHFATVSGLRVPLDDIPSPVYDTTKHGKFRFWSADQWTPFSGSGAKSHEAKKDGVPIFLEDENGKVFSTYKYSELCQLVKGLFQTLAQHSLAPATWGTRTVHAYRYMQHEVYKSFPVLVQCQGHFRLHVLLTQMYPNFARYHLTPAVKKEYTDDDSDSTTPGPLPIGSDTPSGPTKKTSVKRPAMTEVIPSHASKWPKHTAKAVSRRATGKVPSSTVDTSATLPPPQLGTRTAAQVSFNSFSVSYSTARGGSVNGTATSRGSQHLASEPTSATALSVPIPGSAWTTIPSVSPVPAPTPTETSESMTSLSPPPTPAATPHARSTDLMTSEDVSPGVTTTTPATSAGLPASHPMVAPSSSPPPPSAPRACRPSESVPAQSSLTWPAASESSAAVTTAPGLVSTPSRSPAVVVPEASQPESTSHHSDSTAQLSESPMSALPSAEAPISNTAAQSESGNAHRPAMPGVPAIHIPQASVLTNCRDREPIASPQNGRDSLKDNTAAPPLPSLITPALAGLLKAPNTTVTAASETPSSQAKEDVPAIGVSEIHAKKPARQRVTMSRTARNLYASAYLKEHPAATTEEFDHTFRSLSDAIALSHSNVCPSSHEYAHTCPSSEPPKSIVRAFCALSEEQRMGFEEAAKKKLEKTKAALKSSRGRTKGKAKALG
ncbi:hypothetical protein BN946_scf184740.g8 [Trametes cinnabarina]|uniref:Uncharacterized protein n=1 Tax=Pycnoporus cinnabarinus TaxID=5643 RepID=A0A060SP51_PYCCI|nr:hypothetical protein BN946_scf184740.g8 [Trametes cinnabarina]